MAYIQIHKLLIWGKRLDVSYNYDAVYIRQYSKMYQIDVYSIDTNIKWVFDRGHKLPMWFIIHHNSLLVILNIIVRTPPRILERSTSVFITDVITDYI